MRVSNSRRLLTVSMLALTFAAALAVGLLSPTREVQLAHAVDCQTTGTIAWSDTSCSGTTNRQLGVGVSATCTVVTAINVDVRDSGGTIVDSFALTEISPGQWGGKSTCIPSGGGTVDFAAVGGTIDMDTAVAVINDCDCS